MVLKIWGRPNSINVQKVLWCCDELGLDYERIDAGGAFGTTRDPEYLALNPNGLVPTISDDGFVLWESNAIVRYLAAKYGSGTLWPESLEVRAEAEKWMDWQLGTLWASMRPVFIGLIRTPPEERDWTSIRAFREKTIQHWSILDEHLKDRACIAGSSFGMGEIPLGVSAYRWFQLGVDPPPMHNLEAWYHRLRNRPAFEANVTLPLS